jgi:hypothetical protein
MFNSFGKATTTSLAVRALLFFSALSPWRKKIMNKARAETG